MEAILLEVFLCDNYRVRTPQNSQEEMDADKRRGASQPACIPSFPVHDTGICGMHWNASHQPCNQQSDGRN